MKTFIKKRALVIFCCVQFIGALILFWPFLLTIYLALFSLTLILLWQDRTLLPKSHHLSVSVHGPKQVTLNSVYQMQLELEIDSSISKHIKNVIIQPIKSTNLSLPTCRLLKISKNQSKSQYTFLVEAKATKVGELIIDNACLEFDTINFLLTRSIKIEHKPHKIIVSPPTGNIPEVVFQNLTKTQKILKQGISLIKRSRAAEQFHSLRDYRYPDPLKHIDQKKSAKFGSLKTKTFESLHSHHLIICLDIGRAMFGMIGNSQKLDYYIAACMHLSKYAIEHGDQVSFLAFSQKPHAIVSRTKNIDNLWNAIYSNKICTPFEEASDYNLIQKTMKLNATSRSIVVLLSDTSHPYVQDSTYSVIKTVARKHLVISLSLLENKYELNSKISSFNDNAISEESVAEFLYTYWLNDHINAFTQKVDHIGAGALVIPDQYWMSSTTKVYSRLRESNFA